MSIYQSIYQVYITPLLGAAIRGQQPKRRMTNSSAAAATASCIYLLYMYVSIQFNCWFICIYITPLLGAETRCWLPQLYTPPSPFQPQQLLYIQIHRHASDRYIYLSICLLLIYLVYKTLLLGAAIRCSRLAVIYAPTSFSAATTALYTYT